MFFPLFRFYSTLIRTNQSIGYIETEQRPIESQNEFAYFHLEIVYWLSVGVMKLKSCTKNEHLNRFNVSINKWRKKDKYNLVGIV